MKKKRLLLSFVPKNNDLIILQKILTTYEIIGNKIYVFESLENINEIIYTYNIFSDNEPLNKNTISVHRKKGLNIFYTINALNEIVKSFNNGEIDENFPIEWDEFNNNVLIIRSGNLEKIPIKFMTVINNQKKDFEIDGNLM